MATSVPNYPSSSATSSAGGAVPRRESPEYSPLEAMDRRPFDFEAGGDEENLQAVRKAIIAFRKEMAAVKVPRPDEPNTLWEKALDAAKNAPLFGWAGEKLNRTYAKRVTETTAEAQRLQDPAYILQKQRDRLESRRGKSWPLNATSKVLLDEAAKHFGEGLQFGARGRADPEDGGVRLPGGGERREGREPPARPQEAAAGALPGGPGQGRHRPVRRAAQRPGGVCGRQRRLLHGRHGVAYRNNAAVKKSGDPRDSWNDPRNKAGPWKELAVIESLNMGARFLIMGGDFIPWGKTWKAPLVELLSGGALTAFVVNAPRMVAKIFPKWKVNKHLVTITASIAGGFLGGVVTWAAFASDARGPPKRIGKVTFPPLIWAGVRAMINCIVRYPIPKALDSLMGHMMGVSHDARAPAGCQTPLRPSPWRLNPP